MTLALGILGLLQTAWLPGWCAVRAFRLDRFAPPLLLAFALSQLANYLLVQALQPIGAYHRPVLLAVIAAEAAIAGWVGREAWRRPVAAYLSDAADFASRVARLGRASWPRRALLLLALLCVAFYLAAWAAELGRVFRGWDAVQAWNRWAIEWATGQFGAARGFYPHLLPINWSVIYVLTGDVVLEIFPKALMPAYAAMAIYLLLWRAARDGEARDLAGLVFLAAMVPLTMSWIFLDGYADMPAACFGLLAVHVALEAHRSPAPRTALLLAAILGATAALTKASGVIPAVCVLLLAPRIGVRPRIVAAAMMAVLVLPHYVSRGVEQMAKLEGLTRQQQLLQLTGLGTGGEPTYIGKSIGARLADSFNGLARPALLDKLAERAPGAPARFAAHAAAVAAPFAFAFAVALILLALWVPLWRPALLVMLLPYTVIWAVNFGYDGRNLVPVLPIFALCLNAGLGRLAATWHRASTA